jgi:hypothetical protein
MRQEREKSDSEASGKQELGQVTFFKRDVNRFCASYNMRHKYNMLTLEPIWKYVGDVTIGYGNLRVYKRFDLANQVVETKIVPGHTNEDIDTFFQTVWMLQRAYKCMLDRLCVIFLPDHACKR